MTDCVKPPHGLGDLITRFGHIEVQTGAIIGPPGWEAHNMHTTITLPIWGPRRCYLNNALEAPLAEALRRCAALGDGYELRTMGCFAPRVKRVNGDLSVHSWGLAIDINASTNPLAPTRGAPCVKDIPDAWVAIFEEVGFTWGGRFLRPDPMHFQWCTGY